MYVHKGDFVVTLAVEKVSFWGALYPYDADGEVGKETNSDHPAPQLVRNSLICKVDNVWYQGGVFRGFEVESDGLLYLQTNDDFPQDNMGKWYVFIFVIKDIQSLKNGEHGTAISLLERGNEDLNNEWNDLYKQLKTQYNSQELSEKLQSLGLDMLTGFLRGLGGVSSKP